MLHKAPAFASLWVTNANSQIHALNPCAERGVVSRTREELGCSDGVRVVVGYKHGVYGSLHGLVLGAVRQKQREEVCRGNEAVHVGCKALAL